MKLSRHATLYAFYFNPSEEVEIKRGENAGKKMNYTNIVGKVEMIGMVGDGDHGSRILPSQISNSKGYKGCALILQSQHRRRKPGTDHRSKCNSDI